MLTKTRRRVRGRGSSVSTMGLACICRLTFSADDDDGRRVRFHQCWCNTLRDQLQMRAAVILLKTFFITIARCAERYALSCTPYRVCLRGCRSVRSVMCCTSGISTANGTARIGPTLRTDPCKLVLTWRVTYSTIIL